MYPDSPSVATWQQSIVRKLLGFGSLNWARSIIVVRSNHGLNMKRFGQKKVCEKNLVAKGLKKNWGIPISGFVFGLQSHLK